MRGYSQIILQWNKNNRKTQKSPTGDYLKLCCTHLIGIHDLPWIPVSHRRQPLHVISRTKSLCVRCGYDVGDNGAVGGVLADVAELRAQRQESANGVVSD